MNWLTFELGAANYYVEKMRGFSCCEMRLCTQRPFSDIQNWNTATHCYWIFL